MAAASPLRRSVPRELIFISAVALSLAGLTRWLFPELGYTRDPENFRSPTPVYWICSILAVAFGALGMPHVFLRPNRMDLRIGLGCYGGLGLSGLLYLSGIDALLPLATIGAIAVALVARYYPLKTPTQGQAEEENG